MDYADLESIKKMECLAFDDGFCTGYTTILVLDGKEFEYGDNIKQIDTCRTIGWGSMDDNTSVVFEIENRCGRYTTTQAEWIRCIGAAR